MPCGSAWLLPLGSLFPNTKWPQKADVLYNRLQFIVRAPNAIRKLVNQNKPPKRKCLESRVYKL